MNRLVKPLDGQMIWIEGVPSAYCQRTQLRIIYRLIESGRDLSMLNSSQPGLLMSFYFSVSGFQRRGVLCVWRTSAHIQILIFK